MADAKNQTAWKEAKRQILLALNLPAEFEALGLRLAGGGKPNSKGWIYAHSHQADDRNPSAGDESYLGGESRNMHKHRRDNLIRGRGGVGKAIRT